jgi:glutamate decarboxylase
VSNHTSKYEITEEAMTGEAVSSIIRSELRLDGNPDPTLASFVTTEVLRECRDFMIENLNKNLVDASQYRHSPETPDRCIIILANLFHAPHHDNDDDDDRLGGAVGAVTAGSSEAIMLAG